MTTYYLYILYSPSSDRYYVGYTTDVQARIVQHNTSERTTYTSKHRPWRLEKQVELGQDRGFAVQIERAVKRMKSRKYVMWIIDEVENVEQLAQSLSVPTSRD